MEQTTATFLDVLPLAALSIDRQGRIIHCNQRMLELLGSPGLEFTQAINVLNFPSLVQNGLSEIFRNALNQTSNIQVERTYRSIWGKNLVVRMTCTPYPNLSPDDEALLIFIQDITADRQANLELTLANRAKTQFLANMSHEVRTPLNGVIGFLSLLERYVQEPEAREFVDAARSSAKSLLRLINEVLDVAKIEAGSLVIEKKPFQLRPVVNAVLEQVRLLLLEQPLSLQVDVPADLQVLGDSIRYSQVLMNLVSNAIKFTEQGSISIKIQVEKENGQDVLKTEVTDTGIGIRYEHQQLVFQPFTQIDGEHNRHREGAGLGLTICKSLVQLMQGRMGMESRPKLGSRFWFTIPMHPKPQNGDRLMERVFRLETRSPGHRILLLDSDPLQREALAKPLIMDGYQVEESDSDDFSSLAPFHTDLVLLDLQSTGFDPYLVARNFRTQGWNGPIIALTRLDASAGAEEHQRCKESGISDFLTKPCSDDVLLARVRSWLFHPGN